MPYSHQNMIRAINSFFPYLTNDDLNELSEYISTLKDHREKKEEESIKQFYAMAKMSYENLDDLK